MNGKMQPQHIELEEAVLGAILIEKGAFLKVADILTPQCFYKDEHVILFQSITDLSNSNSPIDLISVTIDLRKKGLLETIGGAFYITSLTNRVASTANIIYHAKGIKNAFLKREIIRIGGELIEQGFDESIELNDLIDKIEKDVNSITSSVITSKTVTSKELYTNAIKDNDKLINSDTRMTGVPSGLGEIDRITGGFQNSDLIILAARPGMGKTALALKYLTYPAFMGMSTAIFSLEMSNKQLYARIISQKTGVSLQSVLRRGMNESELMTVMSHSKSLTEAKIFFDDTGGIGIFELRNKARKLKRDHDIKLLVIDYIQLITTKNKGNRENEVSEISRSLKALAKELDIPIIALAQLSRAGEKRGANSKPMLSDLRESGSLEQDADIVKFIYRPEYYNINQYEDGTSTAGRAEILFAKHRNGQIGGVDVGFDSETTNFHNIDVFEQHF